MTERQQRIERHFGAKPLADRKARKFTKAEQKRAEKIVKQRTLRAT